MRRVRIAVAGAAGRMGRRILSLASEDPEFKIVGALEREDSEAIGSDAGSLMGKAPLGVRVTSDLGEALRSAEVLIDFTHPSATEHHLKGALRFKKALVIGTTGLSEKTLRAIRHASNRIPILQSPNMSTGVNLLFELISEAVKVLDEKYDIEITESHHRMKKDAPSGTALELARLIAGAKGWNPKRSILYGRKGVTGERKRDTIAIHALRGGDVVGEHTVSFYGAGEILEFVHRATSRDAFARGALLAAKFVARQRRGLYNMRSTFKWHGS